MLPKRSATRIRAAVDQLFERAKQRLLGIVPKRIVIRPYVNEDLTIPGLYSSAVMDDGGKPNPVTKDRIVSIAESYLDALRERTKAQVVRDVDAVLRDVRASGKDTDVATVLGGRLADTWAKLSSDVERIAATEAQHGRSMGALEGISRINTLRGIDDPVVYFVVVNDQHLCSECKRLHLMPDGATPRVWRMSEVGHGYHKKGESNPKIAGLHPHCRCSLATLLPGWGFGSTGAVEYKGSDHNELARQRGEQGA
jgi:hypothetical protein